MTPPVMNAFAASRRLPCWRTLLLLGCLSLLGDPLSAKQTGADQIADEPIVTVH